ncbi:MAG: hypothetical protein M0P13_11180, partial [Fibrobacteraceae bacterium]|nr:hypothetical protein [Fibrobacteraceae bacterium]
VFIALDLHAVHLTKAIFRGALDSFLSQAETFKKRTRIHKNLRLSDKAILSGQGGATYPLK